jgi:3-isopropylmalate/(R)-2-methylmalate dehydratase small subunit
VPVVVDAAFHAHLSAAPGAEVVIDVDRLTVTVGDDGPSTPFSLDPFARHCLLAGVDELGLLLSKLDAIVAYEQKAQAS